MKFEVLILGLIIILGCEKWRDQKAKNEKDAMNKVFVLSNDEIKANSLIALKGGIRESIRLVDYYSIGISDQSEYLFWLTIAAENDDPDAQSSLGLDLSNTSNPMSLFRAYFWLSRANAHSEEMSNERLRDVVKKISQGKLFKKYLNVKNNKIGFKNSIATDSCEQMLMAYLGDKQIAYSLYVKYSTLEIDLKLAEEWLIIAAQNGSKVGEITYGQFLARACDERSRARADFWLKKSTHSVA